MSIENAACFKRINQWFEKNLPNSKVCLSWNQAEITYFKTKSAKEMLDQIEPAMKLLNQYNQPYDIQKLYWKDSV